MAQLSEEESRSKKPNCLHNLQGTMSIRSAIQTVDRLEKYGFYLGKLFSNNIHLEKEKI